MKKCFVNYLKDDNGKKSVCCFGRGAEACVEIKFYHGDDQTVFKVHHLHSDLGAHYFCFQMHLKILFVEIPHVTTNITIYQYLFHSHTRCNSSDMMPIK